VSPLAVLSAFKKVLNRGGGGSELLKTEKATSRIEEKSKIKLNSHEKRR
jgi:hypothetical protein